MSQVHICARDAREFDDVGTAARFRHICVTWNNPPLDANGDAIRPQFHAKIMRYMVYQLEIGEGAGQWNLDHNKHSDHPYTMDIDMDDGTTEQREYRLAGTLHWQMYVEFKQKIGRKKISELFPGAWIFIRRGTPKQASDYCKVDDTRASQSPRDRGEFGTISDPGIKVDLHIMVAGILSGTLSLSEIMVSDPRAFKSYGNVLDRADQMRLSNPSNMDCILHKETMYKWQRALLREVRVPSSDSRKVVWYVDEIGGAGKTEFAKWLIKNLGATLMDGGSVDMKYLYRGEKIALFNVAKATESKFFTYKMLENLKDGIYVSTKYTTQMRCFRSPHVIVFANFEPDTSKLSQDRWDIRVLSKTPVLLNDGTMMWDDQSKDHPLVNDSQQERQDILEWNRINRDD